MSIFIYNKHKKREGFTLIELLVAIGVIAILAAVAVPSYLGYVKRARKTELTYDAKVLEDAAYRYRLDHGVWPRVGDTPYTAAEVEAFADEIYDCTGEVIALDADGDYYDIDLGALSNYVTINNDSLNFILQNPVGRVYVLDHNSNTRMGHGNTSPQGLGTIAQLKNFGGPGVDYLHSITQDSSGDYVAVGSASGDLSSIGGNDNSGEGFAVFKLDENFNPVAVNNFGGTANDRLDAIFQDNAGNYVAAGHSDSDLTAIGGVGNSGNDDFFMVEMNPQLEITDVHNFGGADVDQLYSAIQSNTGNYIVAGYSLSDLTSLGGSTASSYDFVATEFK